MSVPSASAIDSKDGREAVPPRSSLRTTPTDTPAASANCSCVMPPRSAFKRSEVVYSDHCMPQNLRVMDPTRTVLAGAVEPTAFDQSAVGFTRRAPP